VNKTELIDHIAKTADISKAASARALDALVGAIKTTLKKNGTVTLVGFGTFLCWQTRCQNRPQSANRRSN
jgi:DNA-binding protein HU-beta